MNNRNYLEAAKDLFIICHHICFLGGMIPCPGIAEDTHVFFGIVLGGISILSGQISVGHFTSLQLLLQEIQLQNAGIFDGELLDYRKVTIKRQMRLIYTPVI